jgi:hypothetical protein
MNADESFGDRAVLKPNADYPRRINWMRLDAGLS